MHSSHSEVEYQTKKKNTIHEPAGEHCVQLYGEHGRGVEGSWGGEGKYTGEKGCRKNAREDIKGVSERDTCKVSINGGGSWNTFQSIHWSTASNMAFVLSRG